MTNWMNLYPIKSCSPLESRLKSIEPCNVNVCISTYIYTLLFGPLSSPGSERMPNIGKACKVISSVLIHMGPEKHVNVLGPC